MIEIRIHGRGGQGAVVGAKLLAEALFAEGKFVQAFPEFGVERRGAPVTAFLRTNDAPVNIRNRVYNPDHIIIQDASLLSDPSTLDGLKPGGIVLINSKSDPETYLAQMPQMKIATVDASGIAHTCGLGGVVNTTILGAFAKVSGMVKLESLLKVVEEGAPWKKKENVKAAREAYNSVVAGFSLRECQQL